MEQQPPHHPNPADVSATGTIRRRPHMKRNGSYPNLLASSTDHAHTPAEVTEANRPSRSRHAQTRPRAEQHVHHHHHHHPAVGGIYSLSVVLRIRN